MRRLLYSVVVLLVLALSIPALAQEDATMIEYGQTVSGNISESEPAEYWVFSGTEGDVISIEMISEDTMQLDPRLYLYTEAGFQNNETAIAENDDFEGLNSRIDSFTLPETTNYVIEATRWSGEGAYDLTLTSGEAVETDTISYGETVTAEITDETGDLTFTFTGAAGDVVSISMNAENTNELDPYIELYTAADYAAGNTPLAFNDDAGSLNSLIDSYELPEDGDYVILASRFSGEGNFDLTLESGAMGDAGGAQTVALDNGESAVEIMLPAEWVTSTEAGINAFASTADGLAVFSDEVVPAPDGEIALGIISPEALAQIAGALEEETTDTYLEAALLGFGFEGEVRPYDNFAVPASFTPIEPSADAPENAVMFVLELEEGFTLVVSVTGGNPQDFEDEVVEIVNTMAGVEPSYATEDAMEEDMGGAPPDVDLDNLDLNTFSSDDGSQTITVGIPAGWISDTSFGSLDIGSSNEALNAAQNNEVIPDGEVYISIGYPSDLEEGFGISRTSTPTEALEALNEALQSTGTIEDLPILDAPAAFTTLTDSPLLPDGVVLIAIAFDEGTVGVVFQVGGNIDEFEPIITAILESISFTTE